MAGLRLPTQWAPEVFRGASGPVQVPVPILESLNNASLQWFNLPPSAGGAIKPILCLVISNTMHSLESYYADGQQPCTVAKWDIARLARSFHINDILYVLKSVYGLSDQQVMERFVGPAFAAAQQDCAYLVNETNRVRAANISLRSANKRLNDRNTQETTNVRRHFDGRMMAKQSYNMEVELRESDRIASQKVLQDIERDLLVGLGRMPALPPDDTVFDEMTVENIKKLIAELVCKSKVTLPQKEKNNNAVIAPANISIQPPASGQSLSAQLKMVDPLEKFYYVLDEVQHFASWHRDTLEGHLSQVLDKARAEQLAAGLEQTQWRDNDLQKALTFWDKSSVDIVHAPLDYGENGKAILKKYGRVVDKVKNQSTEKQIEYASLPDFYRALDIFEHFAMADRNDMKRNLNKIKSNSQAGPEEGRVDSEQIKNALSARDQAILDVTRHLSTTTLDEKTTSERHGKSVDKGNGPSAVVPTSTVANFDTAEVLLEMHIYKGQKLSPEIFGIVKATTIQSLASMADFDAVTKLGKMMGALHATGAMHPILVTVQKNDSEASGIDNAFMSVSSAGYKKWMATLRRLIKAGQVPGAKYVTTIKLCAAATGDVPRKQYNALEDYLNPAGSKA